MTLLPHRIELLETHLALKIPKVMNDIKEDIMTSFDKKEFSRYIFTYIDKSLSDEEWDLLRGYLTLLGYTELEIESKYIAFKF